MAPNGTGKTIIALSSLLPVLFEKNLKLIYLCRTHSQNARVIKELIKISDSLKQNNNNIQINGLSIRGRNEMCLNDTLLELNASPRESMAVCSDLRKNNNCKHFLNLLKKRDQYDNPTLIAPEIFLEPIDADDLIHFCKEKQLCPYFLSKFLLEEMKVTICNYQWILHPFIRKTFLKFIGKELKDCVIVIDECHNVIDVATEINSSKISPYSLKLCLKDLEIYRAPKKMVNFLNFLLNLLNKRKKKLSIGEYKINPKNFLNNIFDKLNFKALNEFENFIKEIYKFSSSIHEDKIANGLISRDYVGSLAEYWLEWLRTYLSDKYFFSYNVNSHKERKTISLEIVALDPREVIIPVLRDAYSCLNLSGTVNPYVFSNLMGFKDSGKRYKAILANSPFEKKNIKAIITEGVDTRRENRNTQMYRKIIDKIDEVLYCTPANIGIFCASYRVLNGLIENDIEKIVIKNKKQLFIEKPGLSARENAFLVKDFKSCSNRKNAGGVLLGVCGGRNSEGEDYPGDFMNSIIVAGFPYHLPTPRVQAKIEYYDKVFNNQGWNFGYLYPAIQRANQASGRPIRKLDDKGAIIFMDSRFKQKYNWISKWVQNELEIIQDKEGALIQTLYPFWNSLVS
ncbi:MAG: hypothetical protein EU550_01550 [Promethearchaeota archaeon]|nr:MAG: hypothetical protein EU550_01550 [Candidatus Lokiarchaeota archaeon]